VSAKMVQLGRILRWWSLLRSVCTKMLSKLGIPAAVVVAVTVSLRRWNTRIYRSSAVVVEHGLPLLGQYWTDPVLYNICQGLEIVLWWTFKCRATSVLFYPSWKRPMTLLRVAGSNLDIAAIDSCNDNRLSNTKFYIW